MKPLVVTQKVDRTDPILGFFHRWIEEFSKHYEKVTVICLEEGEHSLPENVCVFSLGKEGGRSRLKYLARFYRYIWRERKNYDRVFVHMNPEYVVLGAPVWKLLSKRVSLWYVHRQVTLKLRIAVVLSDVIFTSAPESFKLKNKKVRYVGHGIDTERFASISPARYEPLTLGHIGRITRIKHIETIIEAFALIAHTHPEAKLLLVGDTVTNDDRSYKKELESRIESLGLSDRVAWTGPMDNVEALEKVSMTINAAPDGGMDKVVLESLAAGRPAFVSNNAFRGVFGEEWLRFSYQDIEGLAEKIRIFLTMGEKGAVMVRLKQAVNESYDVTTVVQKIVTIS